MAIRRATTFVLDRNVGIFWRHAFSKQVIFHIIDKQATVRFPVCSESDSRLFHLGSLIKCRRTTVDAVFSNEEYRKILHTTYDSFHIISLNPCIIQCQCVIGSAIRNTTCSNTLARNVTGISIGNGNTSHRQPVLFRLHRYRHQQQN